MHAAAPNKGEVLPAITCCWYTSAVTVTYQWLADQPVHMHYRRHCSAAALCAMLPDRLPSGHQKQASLLKHNHQRALNDQCSN
jgi:hypothetical protein